MTTVLRRLAWLCLMLMGTKSGAAAGVTVQESSLLCDQAIGSAQAVWKTPPGLLEAVAAVESGRLDHDSKLVRPWPWTINARGVGGQFFATKSQAISAVNALHARGVRSIDVGCMQVNLVAHSGAFPTLDAAFDPSHNARYAAKFLHSLYIADRSWPVAIGRYHSKTKARGVPYRTRVIARWKHPTLARTKIGHPAYRDFQKTSAPGQEMVSGR
jgi:hypothetical protein